MKIKEPASKQPIPPHAKRVFKGKIFDVYHWEQKLFDGSTATFEKIKRQDTVNVFPVTKEGKIILSQQRQPGGKGFIGCLGGRIDKGETPLETAKRELLEEAGLKAKTWLLWDARHLLGKIDWAIYTFVAKDLKKVGKIQSDAGEKIKLIQVSFEQFLKTVTRDNYRDIEIALMLLKAKEDPKKLSKIKELLLK
ncbi:MAG: NUDIX hydrolase [Candidatus Pacebacteria bacterium]|nr:NUDIX hydrolase [Candidatus Paceibacterota bacterium]